MPYKLKTVKGAKRPVKIVNKRTGRVVGSSKTKKMAQASIRARYANER